MSDPEVVYKELEVAQKSGLRGLSQSKRFLTTAVGLLVMVFSALSPQLAEHLDILAPVIVILVMTAVGGYSLQDAARELRQVQSSEEKEKVKDG